MIKVIIVDDEKHGRDKLKVNLGRIEKEKKLSFEILAVCSRAKDAEEKIKTFWNDLDLLFLDIQLDLGIKGIDLLKSVLAWAELENKYPKFKVIIVTNYNQYAKEAIDLSVDIIKYIDKITLETELDEAISAYLQRREKEKIEEEARDKFYRELIERIGAEGKGTKVVVNFARKTLWIDIDDVIFLQGAGHNTELYLSQKAKRKYGIKTKALLINGSVGNWIGRFTVLDRKFVQVHRGNLVNLDYLVESNTQHLILADDSIGYLNAMAPFLKELLRSSKPNLNQVLILIDEFVKAFDNIERYEVSIGPSYAENIPKL